MKPKRTILLALVLVPCIFPVPVHAWETLVVDSLDSGGLGGQYSSIAVDGLGAVHIASLNDSAKALQYTTNSSGSWVTTIVDASALGVGYLPSVAVDSSNKVHICYAGYAATGAGTPSSYPSLKYATNSAGTWAIETIDRGDNVAPTYMGSSIAVDRSDHIHIAYGGSLGTLKYATNSTGSWVLSTIGYCNTSPSYVSIALDSMDNVHISYYYASGLWYATNASGSWVTTKVDWNSNSMVGQYSSIAVDRLNNVHISYADWTNKDLKYATNSTGSWVTSIVDSIGDVGLYTSIAVDSFDQVHISYYDSTNMDLKCASNLSGSWSITTLDSTGDVGQWGSIAVDASDHLHISYYDATNNILKYATQVTGWWNLSTPSMPGVVGQYSSIAVDSLKNLHISYYDFTNRDLKYATNASGVWEQVTVDSGGDVGMYSSIAVDGLNKVHISYSDTTNYKLKYATNSSGGWVTEIVSSGSSASTTSTSIALDGIGRVHIAYYDGGIKYATNASGSWVTQTVRSSSSINGYYYMYPAIALDGLGKVHIVYSYYSGMLFLRLSGLMYSTNTPGSWQHFTVEGGSNGLNPDIAIDSLDAAHISYLGGSNDLKYATNISGSWAIEAVDVGGDVGYYSSITADSSGGVHVSYLDRTNSRLKCARKAGGVWESETICVRPLGSGMWTSIARTQDGDIFISHYGPDGTLLLTSSLSTPCQDSDGDGYGNPESPICPHLGLDCDDTNPAINPGAAEICDGVDNNCNGQIDEEPAASSSCDDGLYCNGQEYCSAGSCHAGTPPNCDDGIACTADACSEETKSCLHTPQNSLCDDGNVCTDDTCNPPTGCVHVNNTAPCNDGNACTTSDTCSGGVCVGGLAPNCDDGNPCTDDICDPASGCVHTNNTLSCDDYNACTTNDHCSGGACVGGPALNCDDGNVCTDDACNPSTGCVHTNNTAHCDNGYFCIVGDHCYAGACVGGTPRDCNDGVPCTVDGCNESGRRCEHVPQNSLCDDGVWCNGAEVCNSQLGCQPGVIPCPDDGLFCNGTESCDEVGHQCLHSGDPCSDGNNCTNDSCNEAAHRCEYQCNATGPGDPCCANAACSGATICQVSLVSIAVTPVNPSIAKGKTQQFTATGTFSDGTTQNLTTDATWSSSDVAVAIISNTAGSNGLATAVAAGSTTITATLGSISGSTTLTVTSCFIATASFGTEMAEKISVLQGFRDTYLVKSDLGRAFVTAYYRRSAPVADYIAERPWLKAVVRTLLLPFVGFVSLFV